MKIPTALPVALALAAAALAVQPAPAQTDFGLNPKHAELIIKSDKGEFIGDGQNYDFKTPGDVFYLEGTRKHLVVQVPEETWSVDLARSDKKPLGRGHFKDTKRYPFDGKNAGLTVSSPGKECESNQGSFTIRGIRFNKQGWVQAIDASFLQRCEGKKPRLRGSVVVNPQMLGG